MRLGGLQKMTLLDFPGRVACTVFTQGCNFRCPFCHNTPLVLTGGAAGEEILRCAQKDRAEGTVASDARRYGVTQERDVEAPSPTGRNTEAGEEILRCAQNDKVGGAAEEYPVEEFFRFLEKRRGLLDGVAITGGEPLLHSDMPEFLRRIRALGYAVKLDTNGAFPDRLRALIDEGLVDYVAVDIKNSPEKYAMTAGTERGADGILRRVEETVRLLMEGRVDYEFRTTLVDELHEPEDFTAIGQWIAGAPRYFIQGFVDSGHILGGEAVFHAASAEQARACLEAVREFVPNAELRGQ